MGRTKPDKRTRPPKGGKFYRQLWRLVDGAVKDCFKKHPDYLTLKGHIQHRARQSINKRVVGTILGYTQEAGISRTPQRGGRSGGANPPAVDSA